MRISRHQCFMQVAEVIARRSTCFRRNVGAVLTINHRIVSVGYNGAPSGQPHCSGNGCADPAHGCTRALHAEVNVLAHVPRGIGLLAGTARLYVTESPCESCAEAIVAFEHGSVIDEVYFMHQYRLTAGCELLVNRGVVLYRMTPSGDVIDWRTNKFVDDEVPSHHEG